MTTPNTSACSAALLAVATATPGEDIDALWRVVSETLDGIALATYAAAPLATMTEAERTAYSIRLQVWRGASMRAFRETIGGIR